MSLSECINDETINGIPIKLRCLSRIRFSHRTQRRLKLDLSLDLSKSTDQTQDEVSKVTIGMIPREFNECITSTLSVLRFFQTQRNWRIENYDEKKMVEMN